jgi:hypothetical protein
MMMMVTMMRMVLVMMRRPCRCDGYNVFILLCKTMSCVALFWLLLWFLAC